METSPRTLRRLLLSVLFIAIPAVTLVASPAQSAVVIDGSAAHRAAASCWEIKQNVPNAPDGRYWLVTPQLQAPAQFYCDMTTNGGGWVLVGRGRDGWMWDGNGKGTIDQVSTTITGTGAFSPRELSDAVIDGLLGGRRPDSLTDGVRLRRATNTGGTSWQEVRFNFKTRDRWSWALGAGHPITSFSMDGSSSSTLTTTRDFGLDSGQRRVTTNEASQSNYIRGFNFGQNGIGTNSASSFVYSTATGGRYASPFTQVFIRPKTLTSDMSYAAIPDSGTNAQTALPVAKNGALPATWGVTGTGAAGTGELATEAQAFAQVGNTMFVGGNFTTVQKGATPRGPTRSPSPTWRPSMRPPATGSARSGRRSNNQVKSLTVLPGNKLAVGGDFTTVNGTARRGLVVMNSSTGELDPTWDSTFENRIAGSGGAVSVRGLDTSGTHLYVGGIFSHVVRGTSAVFGRNGVRFSLATGRADSGWNPDFNGTVDAVDVADDNTRVYFAGYFTKSGAATADRGAAISTGATASQITPVWQPTFSTSSTKKYQQALKQVGDRVWLGGSEHSMFSYDTSTFALKSSSITSAGGDLQAIGANNKVVYGGCHCGDWNFQDTTVWDGLAAGQTNIKWSQGDKIMFVGAWRADNGNYIPEFAPQWKARTGYGAWGLKVADDGTLWAGGSFISAVKENGANQWVGGFARFAVRPHTAPGAPSSPSVSLVNGKATVKWTAGSTSGVTYEVIRNDRVVALTTGSSATVDDSTTADKFFVRASDGQGNRSASTNAVKAAAEAQTVLATGSTWRYLFDNTVTVSGSWKDASFDDSAWKSGPAALGWGSSGPIATNIDVAAGQTRAITSYHRTSFDVSDPAAFTGFLLTTRADDGIVVYINGTEVKRTNLPAGAVGPNTFATAAPSTASAINNPVTVQIPTNLIQAGSNSIAVEVHSNYRGTPNTSIEATIEGQG